MFTVADKGNSTVAIDKTVYIDRMTTLSCDVSTCKEIEKSPLKDMHSKIYSLLKD